MIVQIHLRGKDGNRQRPHNAAITHCGLAEGGAPHNNRNERSPGNPPDISDGH